MLTLTTFITGLPWKDVFNALSKTSIGNATGEVHKITGLEVAPVFEEGKPVSIARLGDGTANDSKGENATPPHISDAAAQEIKEFLSTVDVDPPGINLGDTSDTDRSPKED